MVADSENCAVRRSQSALLWLLIFAVLAVVVHYLAPRPTPGQPVTGYARVIDGDTLDIRGQRIRLFGIDAPEREQDCRDAASRTYACGREAARALTSAIAGRAVTCTPVDHDRYDRDVAVCTAEGDDLGEAMVRSGHALDLARHSRRRYADAERDARDARRGLWAGPFDTPAVWRRQQAN
jgi:endonuclease YncB( thermonuclease family)